MNTKSSVNDVVTSYSDNNLNMINDILGKLCDARKDYNIKLAEIYINIAKVLFSSNNIELQKNYYKRIYENNYIAKVDLDAAKQLIKIKGIEKYLDLGWPALLRIRECSKKTEELNFLIAEEKNGDLHDRINLETYLIKRLLATKSIQINDDVLLKYVTNGLRFEHFTENGLTELSKSRNKTRTLFKIRHNGITSDTKKIIKKSRISKNDQIKLLQMNAMLNNIINDNERYKFIDESIVHDIYFNVNKLLDIIQNHYNGEYPYGVSYDNETEEIDKVIDDILNNYFIKVDGEYILKMEKK